MTTTGIRQRVLENPFYVLGLPLTCTRHEMEREGSKLLSMLELKLQQAAVYTTPLGPRERTAELVRQAMAELRDPGRRLLHELVAQLPAGGQEERPQGPDPALAWEDALAALGLGR